MQRWREPSARKDGGRGGDWHATILRCMSVVVSSGVGGEERIYTIRWGWSHMWQWPPYISNVHNNSSLKSKLSCAESDRKTSTNLVLRNLLRVSDMLFCVLCSDSYLQTRWNPIMYKNLSILARILKVALENYTKCDKFQFIIWFRRICKNESEHEIAGKKTPPKFSVYI